MATADEVINQASKFLGARYKTGGVTIAGIDCSGLIFAAFNSLGANNEVGGGRTTANGYVNRAKANNTFHTGLAGIQRGDLIVYDHVNSSAKIDHIGIYEGNGKVISALINPWGVSEHNVTLPKENAVGYIRPQYSGTSTPTGTTASYTPQQIQYAKDFLVWWNANPLSHIATDSWESVLTEFAITTHNQPAADYVKSVVLLFPKQIDPKAPAGPFGWDSTHGGLVLTYLTVVSGQSTDFGPFQGVADGITSGITGFFGQFYDSLAHGFYFLIFIMIGLVILYIGFRQRGSQGASNE